MTLAELLALLPDNPEGNISAADMRLIVTDLWTKAHTDRVSLSYTYKTSGVPGAVGDVMVPDGWVMGANDILISETAQDGLIPSFLVLDDASGAGFQLRTADGNLMEGLVTGDSIDQGGYREIPVSVSSVVGGAPSGGERVTVTVRLVSS